MQEPGCSRSRAPGPTGPAPAFASAPGAAEAVLAARALPHAVRAASSHLLLWLSPLRAGGRGMWAEEREEGDTSLGACRLAGFATWESSFCIYFFAVRICPSHQRARESLTVSRAFCLLFLPSTVCKTCSPKNKLQGRCALLPKSPSGGGRGAGGWEGSEHRWADS